MASYLKHAVSLRNNLFTPRRLPPVTHYQYRGRRAVLGDFSYARLECGEYVLSLFHIPKNIHNYDTISTALHIPNNAAMSPSNNRCGR